MELKISDLSVGDWIHHDFYEVDMRVVTIYRDTERIIAESSSGYGVTCHIDHFSPSPITPEILEANGWHNGMYAILRIDEHLHLEYYYHEHRLRKWYCGVDEWENHAKVNDITFQAHCYSVHQLQHALRLAGVDKEIVMPKK